jgi:cob(I)alamin adenosyltransferase
MGHRLSKIYTRTGDDGTTGLADGSRLAKHDPRIEAMGDVDELNSFIGLVLTESPSDTINELLTRVQHTLFDLGAELSLPDQELVAAEATQELERALDELNQELAPLKEFVLPGGCRAAALAHLARGVCRRAERRLFALHASRPVNRRSLRYLNRLSDYLFVAARYLNKSAGVDDVMWQSPKNK